MFDRRYFVYMLQSVSRRVLYIGFTNFLIARALGTSHLPLSEFLHRQVWKLALA